MSILGVSTRIFILIGGWALLLGAGLPPIPTLEYVIVKGDTCAAVAKKHYGDSSRYDVIHQYNPQLGPRPPHHLEPGSVLKLPKKLPPDAWITRVRAQVEHRSANKTAWTIATRNDRLRLGHRVVTRADSSAELTFLNQSVLTLRAETLVLLSGKGLPGAQTKRSRAFLERGTLRSHLAALAGQKDEPPPVDISTPSAESSFSQCEAVMSVDDTGRSSLSNHAGESVELRGKAGGKVKVKKGMGAFVRKGQRPSKPRTLPKAPAWGGPKALTVPAHLKKDALVRLRWRTPDAKTVRVRLRTLDSDTALFERSFPVDLPVLNLRGLKQGTYRVDVLGIDVDGLESTWSNPLVIEITPGEGPVNTVVGALLDLPDLKCTLNGEGIHSLPVGSHTVQCPDGEIQYTVTQATATQVSKKTLHAGKTTLLTLALEPADSMPSVLDLWVGQRRVPMHKVKAGWQVDVPVSAKAGKSLKAVIRDPALTHMHIATVDLAVSGGQ